MRTYEGLFLLEPTIAAKEWDKALGEVQRILQKAEAQPIASIKWGERKLAYSVGTHKRGSYYLAQFKAGTDGVNLIRRECELSDIVLRAMLIRVDGPLKPPAPPPQEISLREESDFGGRRDGRRGRM